MTNSIFNQIWEYEHAKRKVISSETHTKSG